MTTLRIYLVKMARSDLSGELRVDLPPSQLHLIDLSTQTIPKIRVLICTLHPYNRAHDPVTCNSLNALFDYGFWGGVMTTRLSIPINSEQFFSPATTLMPSWNPRLTSSFHPYSALSRLLETLRLSRLRLITRSDTESKNIRTTWNLSLTDWSSSGFFAPAEIFSQSGSLSCSQGADFSSTPKWSVSVPSIREHSSQTLVAMEVRSHCLLSIGTGSSADPILRKNCQRFRHSYQTLTKNV